MNEGLSPSQRTILEALYDDDAGLWEIGRLAPSPQHEKTKADVETLIRRGLTTLYWYEPPFEPSASRAVPSSRQKEFLDDRDSWRLPPGDVPHVRLGLTPATRREMEK